MTPRAAPLRWLLLLVLGVAACGPAPADTTVTDTPATAAAAPTADPALVEAVTTTFATYRSAVEQGDAEAAMGALDDRSVADMARVADLARTAEEQTVRELPAAEQLLVLTYRLRPELLEAEDPYAALLAARFGGQDRSLGDLGSVTPVGEDQALGVITDPTSGTETPLRWRFHRQQGEWRFDLVEGHRLLSQAISNNADRAGVPVHDLVAATVVDLSGEEAATVEALYTETPG